MSVVLSDIDQEMRRVIDAARERGILLRVVGGLAFRAQSADHQRFFKREYPDIDFVIEKLEYGKIQSFFQSIGYSPNKQFNILNGTRRQIYFDEQGRHIDVFVGDFEMCHKIPLKDRLHLDPFTIPLAELFLSKAQIVELNRKDALDMIMLLLNNHVGEGDDKTINVNRVAELCVNDWGLYTTASINLKRVEELIRNEEIGLTDAEKATLLDRVQRVQRALEESEKPLAWKLRDRVGVRVRWYTEVEEVSR